MGVKASIIATLGPSSHSHSVIEKLLRAGADVFRLNLSHGSRTDHKRAIRALRQVSRALGLHAGLVCDLQGPKIRTGRTEHDQPVFLKKGASIQLTAKLAVCDKDQIFIDYPRLHRDVQSGQHILINDGSISLVIISVDEKQKTVQCKVVQPGEFSSHKGVNFPETGLKIPFLTSKDKEDIAFLLSQDIDFFALSFVRQPRDMLRLSSIVRESGKDIKCIAKIEKPQAAADVEGILDVCDGIMVARGDLAVETSSSGIPLLQKDLISAANRKGKLVIVATQMLESMIHNPVPTRAETTDVANAILDGADAVMLSGETAVGRYPVESVKTMVEIAVKAESSGYFPRQFRDMSLKRKYPPHALCEAACWAAHDLGDVPVIAFTLSGDTARYLSKLRCQSPVFAFTPFVSVARSLSLYWNITPIVLGSEHRMSALQAQAEKLLVQKRKIRKGDLVIILYGKMLKSGITNLLKIKTVA